MSLRAPSLPVILSRRRRISETLHFVQGDKEETCHCERGVAIHSVVAQFIGQPGLINQANTKIWMTPSSVILSRRRRISFMLNSGVATTGIML